VPVSNDTSTGGHVPTPTPVTPVAGIDPMEDDDMTWKRYTLAQQNGDGRVFMGDGMTRRHIKDLPELADVQDRIRSAGGDAEVQQVDRIDWLGKEI
jgi:hypothetical protein